MTKLLLSEWNVLLMAAVWVCTAIAERAFPTQFEKGRLINRLEPLFPIVACIIFATMVPGPWMPTEGVTIGQKVILGVILGAGSHNFTAMAKRFGLTPFVAKLNASKRKSRVESLDPAPEDDKPAA